MMCFVFLLDARQQQEVDDNVDIGIVPAQGLLPPELCVSDMENGKSSEASEEVTSITQQILSRVRPEEENTQKRNI